MRNWLLAVTTTMALTLGGGGLAAAPLDELYDAILAGDTRAAVDIIPSLYEERGDISWFRGVEWRIEPYDMMFNSYDPFYEVIALGAMPAPAEVDAYWGRWSALLTEGRWRADAFFADGGDAARMAGFNQFVLAMHEAGHALKYRYDPDHFQRDERSINCREFHADILTAGLLQELAAEEARFAALRARYLELMTAIEAAIDPEKRYAIEGAEALVDNCRLIEVAQPTPDDMAAYAGAFFTRQGLLMRHDLPTMRQLADRYLIPYRREALGNLGYMRPPVPTRTVARVPATAFDAGEDRPFENTDRIPVLSLDGELFVLEVTANWGNAEGTAPLRQQVRFGTPEALEMVAPMAEVNEAPAPSVRVLNGVAWGPDAFAVLLKVGDDDLGLFRAIRRDGVWDVSMARPFDTLYPTGALALTPAGRLVVFAGPYYLDSRPPNRLDIIDIDVETLATEPPLEVEIFDGEPRALGEDGTIYGVNDFPDFVIRQTPDGARAVVAGSGLDGVRDGADPSRVEFNTLSLALDASVALTRDNRLLVTDIDPLNGDRLVREMLLPAVGGAGNTPPAKITRR